MPKRLLSADDQPMVLDGLRRALREMRFEWEKFVDTRLGAHRELDRESSNSLNQSHELPAGCCSVSPIPEKRISPQSKKI